VDRPPDSRRTRITARPCMREHNEVPQEPPRAAVGHRAPGGLRWHSRAARRVLVEMRGHDYHSPLSTMRTHLEDMREARFEAAQPEHYPPWLLAALGPKMLELARDLADGANPYLVTPRHTAEAREILGEGPLLVVEQPVASTTDREEALRLARFHLSRYLKLRTTVTAGCARASKKKISQAKVASSSPRGWWPGDPGTTSASGCTSTSQPVRIRCACKW